MPTDRRPIVRYIFPISHRFRVPFHAALRSKLNTVGVDYEVVYSEPFGPNLSKNDTEEIPWGTKAPLVQLPMTRAVLQVALRSAFSSDLVILQQENRLLLNYLVQLAPRALGPKIAFFGHGRNFQSRSPHGLSEKWKKVWALRCDWWFAYTDETRRHLESLGFPPKRITVFNNATDTTRLRQLERKVTDARRADRRRELGLKGANVGVYVGGLYEDKRIDFLVRAAERVRSLVPDFELLMIGGGPSEGELRALAETRPWIKVTGPRFGADKVELMSLGKLFLMPGLVGLAVLDAGVLGLPMITTAFPWHSPEIAYLEDGVNGLKIGDWRSEDAYAGAVAGLLQNPARLAEMSEAARQIASHYTVEAMAERFAQGVQQALHD